MTLKTSPANINIAALSLIAASLLASCGTHRSGQSQLNGRPSLDGTTAEFKRIFDSAKKISSPEDLKAVPMGDVCTIARDAMDTPEDPRNYNGKVLATFSKPDIGQGFVVKFALGPRNFYIQGGEAREMHLIDGFSQIIRARFTENSALVFEGLSKVLEGSIQERFDPSEDFPGYGISEYILTTGAPVDGKCP